MSNSIENLKEKHTFDYKVKIVSTEPPITTSDGCIFDSLELAEQYVKTLQEKENLRLSLEKLEEEFSEALEKVNETFANLAYELEKLNEEQKQDKIEEIRALSDKYGIPFGYSDDKNNYGYLPKSYYRWKPLREINDIKQWFDQIFLDIHCYLKQDGWNSSYIC